MFDVRIIKELVWLSALLLSPQHQVWFLADTCNFVLVIQTDCSNEEEYVVGSLEFLLLPTFPRSDLLEWTCLPDNTVSGMVSTRVMKTVRHFSGESATHTRTYTRPSDPPHGPILTAGLLLYTSSYRWHSWRGRWWHSGDGAGTRRYSAARTSPSAGDSRSINLLL